MTREIPVGANMIALSREMMRSLDLRRLVSTMLDRVFPKRHMELALPLAASLIRRPLCVIDVGGAMGPDARWALLPAEALRIMSFEPDTRSQDSCVVDKGRDLTLAIGLADTAGERTLHLTAGPFASSLYPPNEKVLRAFGVWPWYEPAGETSIMVETLDSCLRQNGEWRADFVKVDVEGADLDVLKGGCKSLETAFGLQIEVDFASRNVGAPLQSEVDLWLRNAGFHPHLLFREHWVRSNGVHGALSQPQLAWADAVYFRDCEWAIASIARADSVDEAERRLSAMLAILLAYGAHDYAADIVAAALEAGAVSESFSTAAAKSVTASLVALGPFAMRGVAALSLAVVLALPLAVLGQRGRNAGRDLIAAQAAPLCDALSRAARRAGLQRSCVADC